MNIKIRHAVFPEDTAQIALLASQQVHTDPDKRVVFDNNAFFGYVKSQTSSQTMFVWGVAEDEDRYLRGYINILFSRSVYDPTRIYAREFGYIVDPELIGCGLGRQLLEWAENEAAQRGACRIDICALPKDVDPNSLCAKLEKRGYWQLETIWSKTLTER